MVYDFKKDPQPNRQEPFSIYKKGYEPIKVFAIDYPGWKAQGWTEDESLIGITEPLATTSEPLINTVEVAPSEYEVRKAELENLFKDSWRKLAAIAEPLGISKPEGGWEEAIPLVLEAEGLNASGN